MFANLGAGLGLDLEERQAPPAARASGTLRAKVLIGWRCQSFFLVCRSWTPTVSQRWARCVLSPARARGPRNRQTGASYSVLQSSRQGGPEIENAEGTRGSPTLLPSLQR